MNPIPGPPQRTGGPRPPPLRPPAPASRWMHEVRNELNTAAMSAAAATSLLQAGEVDEALINLRRTESACRRCAQLLESPDAMRPQ